MCNLLEALDACYPYKNRRFLSTMKYPSPTVYFSFAFALLISARRGERQKTKKNFLKKGSQVIFDFFFFIKSEHGNVRQSATVAKAQCHYP